MTLRFISYGGGVQSTALLVLAAQGRIAYDTAVMANVGDDSEHPATLAYVRDVAIPWAAEHGITVHLIDRVKRDGTTETLMGRLMNPIKCPKCHGTKVVDSQTQICPRCNGAGEVESRSLPIPVRMSNGAPGTRSCTADFKIRVTGKWAKAHGATTTDPATVAIGISVDEIHRANRRRTEPHELVVYPLVSIGEDTGLRLRRDDCARIIADAGLPIPPKSSCFFCPFHRPSTWQDMRRDEPELFERAAELEDTLNRRRQRLGKDPVFLTRFGVPLRQAVASDQELLPLVDDCDGGWCHT